MQRGFFQKVVSLESKGLLQLKGDDLIQRKVVGIIRHPDGLCAWCIALAGSRFSQKPWDTWLGDGNFSVLRALARRQGVAFAATLTVLKATLPKNSSERADTWLFRRARSEKHRLKMDLTT